MCQQYVFHMLSIIQQFCVSLPIPIDGQRINKYNSFPSTKQSSNIGVDWVAEMAFWFSLLYNIVRTMLTLYLASLVHEYTKKIQRCLREVPSRSWSIEVGSLSIQLHISLAIWNKFMQYLLNDNVLYLPPSPLLDFFVFCSGLFHGRHNVLVNNYRWMLQRYQPPASLR